MTIEEADEGGVGQFIEMGVSVRHTVDVAREVTGEYCGVTMSQDKGVCT